MNDDELIPTRESLLKRLKRWDDHQGWQEFFNTYRRLIHRVATKAGLTEAEAQDVVQRDHHRRGTENSRLQVRRRPRLVQELVAPHHAATD